MNHLGTVDLQNDKLLLRRFALSDAEAMYKNWASDAEVTKYLMWPTHTGVDISESVIQSWIDRYHEKDWYQWAIVLKCCDTVVGSIGAVDKNDRIKMVHIGYCIGRKWWGQGITTEALSLLVDFFFNQVGINRIESRHNTANPASGRVMEKCGLIYEGTQRDGDFDNQGICDTALYAILAKDYGVTP